MEVSDMSDTDGLTRHLQPAINVRDLVVSDGDITIQYGGTTVLKITGSADGGTVSGTLLVKRSSNVLTLDGTAGEFAYDTTTNDFYGCTSSGSPGTWAVLHS
jgi:hypothetical protein